MAQLHRHGRVLPERPPAYMDWLVCATPAPLVSRLRHRRYARARVGPGVHAVSAAALADPLLLHRHRVADSGYSYGKLHLPELPRLAARSSPAGRPFPAACHAARVAAAHCATAEYTCTTSRARPGNRRPSDTNGGWKAVESCYKFPPASALIPRA